MTIPSLIACFISERRGREVGFNKDLFSSYQDASKSCSHCALQFTVQQNLQLTSTL